MGKIRQTGDVVYGEIAFLLVDASHDHGQRRGVSPLSMASSSSPQADYPASGAGPIAFV